MKTKIVILIFIFLLCLFILSGLLISAKSAPANANKKLNISVWVRPTPISRDEIRKEINDIKSLGIEKIVLETFYQGGTIYPSDVMKEYGFCAQKKEFQGNDYLKLWVEEAHRQGLNLDIWFETFYIGNADFSQILDDIKLKYPDWLNKQFKDLKKEFPEAWEEEHDGFFLDPANPEVQDFLIALINEISTKYAIDGINLDYIRYPKSDRAHSDKFKNTSWGYTNYALEEFEKNYGISPVELEPNNTEWANWTKYREEKVTNFLKRVYKITSKNNIILSAAIFPSTRSSKLTLQDWTNWSECGLVDAIIPLIGSKSLLETKNKLNYIQKSRNNLNIKVFPAVFDPYQNQNESKFYNKMQFYKHKEIQGLYLFDYAHIKNNNYKSQIAKACLN